MPVTLENLLSENEISQIFVKAEGWTDADIDRIIEEERENVSPRLG